MRWVALSLAACSNGGSEPPPEPSSPPPPGPQILEASCLASVLHALQATCHVVVDEPLPLEVEITDGEETALFRTAGGALDVDVPVWGLTAEARWTYTVRLADTESTGTFDTGPLPEAMTVHVQTIGTTASLEQVISPMDCVGGGWVAVLDTQGRVRWFADSGGLDVDLVHWTDDGTALWIADKTQVTEVDATGRVVFSPVDLALPVHHDVFRRGDLVYTLQADTRLADDGLTYVEDIVVAYDRAGDEVWRWDTQDHLDPTLALGGADGFWAAWFPGTQDAWHTNALHVTEDGQLLVSLNHEDTVLGVSVADGSVRWALSGGGNGPAIQPTFTLAQGHSLGDPTFDDPHHVVLYPNGHLTVFDNARDRALELALDEQTHTATFVREWQAGLNCPIQSSVFPLGSGGHLLTCAEAHTYIEFDAAGGEVGRRRLSCPNGAVLPRTTRGQPIDVWNGVTAGGVTATRVW